MKESNKESRERKVDVVAEKEEKKKTTTTSRTDAHAREVPLKEVTREDIERFVNVFNEEMVRMNAVIPTVVILSDQSIRQLTHLMKRYPMSKLEKMVVNAAASDFLNGGGQRGFKADLEWLTREANFIKVVNNKYANIPRERQWHDVIEERRLMIEERKQREREQRLRNREIEKEERERRRRQREYDAAHAATPEEIKRIMAGFELPRLTSEQEYYLRRKK